MTDPLKRATGWVAPRDRYVPPVLFNPYTGEPRDARDIQTDPQGILIRPPGAQMLAAPICRGEACSRLDDGQMPPCKGCPR